MTTGTASETLLTSINLTIVKQKRVLSKFTIYGFVMFWFYTVIGYLQNHHKRLNLVMEVKTVLPCDVSISVFYKLQILFTAN